MDNSRFFPFLRFCLHDEPCAVSIWDDMDWEGLHEFALQQALLGVVFDGVRKAGEYGARPPQGLLMRWYAESEQIRRRNVLVDEVCVEVSRRFAADGFRSCILKGQGNAAMYPNPRSRVSGDVDIWIEGGRRRVLDYVRLTSPGAPFQYHHVDYPPVRGVGVEVHFMPSFFCNPFQNRRMQSFFNKFADEQFSHLQPLPDGTGDVAVPTDAFNRIFQLTHIMRHLFDEGIGLRQLLDYYYLLRRGCTAAEKEETAKWIDYIGMTRFAGGLMYVLQQAFALEDEYLLVAPNERLGRAILGEVLHGGNFGHHEDRFSSSSDTSLGYTVAVMRRLSYLFRYFPLDCLFRPLFLLWHPLWRRLYK